MISDLLPKSHHRHAALPVLGSLLNDFDEWLIAQGYRYFTRQCYVLRCTAIEEYFHQHAQHNLATLTLAELDKCWRYFHLAPAASRIRRLLAAFFSKPADLTSARSSTRHLVRRDSD